MREAKARLRQVLEALADKYGITAKDVAYAIGGYADDMLSDLAFGMRVTWGMRLKASPHQVRNLDDGSSRRALAG